MGDARSRTSLNRSLPSFRPQHGGAFEKAEYTLDDINAVERLNIGPSDPASCPPILRQILVCLPAPFPFLGCCGYDYGHVA